MEANWIQTIEARLAEVPPGTLVEVSPGGAARYHRPDPRWKGRGRMETYPLFPGAVFTHLWVLGEALPHRHAPLGSGLEITHCRLGRVGWEMQEGLTLYLGPGDLALHPMACCARSLLRFPLEGYEGFSLSLDVETLKAHLPPALALGRVDPGRLLEKFCPQGKPAALPARADLDHIFRPLYDLPADLRPAYYTLKAEELLLYLAQTQPPKEGVPQAYLSQQVEVIRAIHDQLMAHPDRRVTIEALARAHHMNASTLKSVFKAVYGEPIASHMKRHRMEDAARLLRETDRSVGDIAQQVGYKNQSKFSKVFRDHFQVLPTAYRREHGGYPDKKPGDR
ncbi:MAG TPA: AraC family transcriptional regulator [Candidatus Evtepia faecavium]|nr:AraC family transcriptional regulator [Candidatus Evtepia faecavium]